MPSEWPEILQQLFREGYEEPFGTLSEEAVDSNLGCFLYRGASCLSRWPRPRGWRFLPLTLTQASWLAACCDPFSVDHPLNLPVSLACRELAQNRITWKSIKKKSWFVCDLLNFVIIKLTLEQRKSFPKSYNSITMKLSLISF